MEDFFVSALAWTIVVVGASIAVIVIAGYAFLHFSYMRDNLSSAAASWRVMHPYKRAAMLVFWLAVIVGITIFHVYAPSGHP